MLFRYVGKPEFLSMWFMAEKKLHINTDFSVTVWMLCVIPYICKDAKYHSYIDHRKQVNNVIKRFFMDYLKTKWLYLKVYFGLST